MIESDSIPTNPSVYTDVQGLSALKRQARDNPQETLRTVAKQFEGMFMQMMLQSMREAGDAFGDGLLDSQQSKFYEDMYDKQLVTNLSEQSHGIGLADMLVRQLQGTLPQAADPDTDKGVFGVPERGAYRALTPGERIPVESTVVERRPPRLVSVQDGAAVEGDPPIFDSPEDFVRGLWPHAQAAAKRLGVEPQVLLSQAALETGWGKHVIHFRDGRTSHNLFNIKADERWSGSSVGKVSLEYRDGVAVREQSRFRAYDSYAESFSDYVDFLQQNPRYRAALSRATNPDAFIKGLQKAGYATDPTYASKVLRILNGGAMNGSLAALEPQERATLF